MRHLALLALLLLAVPAVADTIIFTETCNTSPAAVLSSSTTVTVGTSWGTVQTVDGSAGTITSGTTNCQVGAGWTNSGGGYIAAPNPSTDAYYADFQWIDNGAIGNTVTIGMYVNWIDNANFYACTITDDATGGATRIVKVSGGTGSTLTSGTQGTVPINDIIECRIDYTGTNPVITFSNATDATQFLTVTDSSSPLTETRGAGLHMGAIPTVATDDDSGSNLVLDTFRVTEVVASASRHAVVIQ